MIADWSLTITPATDMFRSIDGYAARCSCGYMSPLQHGDDALGNVTMAARQHLQHWHSRTAGDPNLDEVGLEIAESKNAGWCWRCHVCDEQELHLTDETTARSRAADHGRQYRHHRKAARTSTPAGAP